MKSYTPINKAGVFAKEFPIEEVSARAIKEIDFVKDYKDLVEVSDKFHSAFENAGYIISDKVYTVKPRQLNLLLLLLRINRVQEFLIC